MPSHPFGIIICYLKLPKNVEDLPRDVYAHFHRSWRRQEAYKEFQAFFDADSPQLLSSGQTWWRSLEECVNRLLEQYEVSRQCFTLTASLDPSHSNDCLLPLLQNRFVQADLELLSFQLERFNAFDRLFQCGCPFLNMLKLEIESFLNRSPVIL